MALSINQYTNKVNKMIAALPAEVERVNNGLALSVIPLIVNRLIDLGVDGKNKKLGTYSPGYKKYREFNNLPTNFVTLSFTGETLADIGVLESVVDGSSVVTTIGSTGKTTKGKVNTKQILDYLGKNYGTNILSLNEEEEILLAKSYELELQKIIDKFLD